MPRRKRERDPAHAVHLVDTNILIRYVIGDDPPKAERARSLMARIARGEETVRIPIEVVTESVWTLEKRYQVPRPDIAARLRVLFARPGVLVGSAPLVDGALELYGRHHIDFVDCLLAARSRLSGIPVYSFDRTDFKKLAVDWESP